MGQAEVEQRKNRASMLPSEPQASGSLSRSLSSPAVWQIGDKAKHKSSPLRHQGLVLVKPFLDRYGHSHSNVKNAQHLDDWNRRHHLVDSTNELKPAGIRQYFSSPHTLEELEGWLGSSPSCQNLLNRLHQPEVMLKRSIISCDNGPSSCPERYEFGGSMHDRDGKLRGWNDRWTKGIGLLNEHCHPAHRTYFTQDSIFEDSPTQSWRRFMHQEVSSGVWVSSVQKNPPQFGRMGGVMRGRSGTPIPGATT